MPAAPDVDWERTVFTLIPPDALTRGLGTAVLDRFVDAGFSPVASAVVWKRPENLDEYNARNITEVWKAYLYRMIDLLFTYGPTVALLMRDDRPPGELNSHQRMRALKGASAPSDALPGTIRHDLRAINVTCDLVHASDTPAESQTESVSFADELGWSGVDGDRVRDLIALTTAGYRHEDREFDQVLACVRARVAGVLWDDLTPAGQKLALSWQHGGVAEIAAVGAGAGLAALLHDPDRHPLAPLLRCEFLPDSPRIDLARFGDLLRGLGGYLDRWEELVLTSSMWFRPLRTVVPESCTVKVRV
jgi:nucleoside diphosphate kinase